MKSIEKVKTKWAVGIVSMAVGIGLCLTGCVLGDEVIMDETDVVGEEAVVGESIGEEAWLEAEQVESLEWSDESSAQGEAALDWGADDPEGKICYWPGMCHYGCVHVLECSESFCDSVCGANYQCFNKDCTYL